MNDLISRQAAIDAVYERIKQIGYENSLSILSIGQAIRDLPSAQPKMDDLISKRVIQDALIERISKLNAEGEKSIQTARELIRFKRFVDGLTPTADRTGWWVDDNGRPYNGKPNGSCWCSKCGEWLVASDEYNVSKSYCPNCGVRMLNGGKQDGNT